MALRFVSGLRARYLCDNQPTELAVGWAGVPGMPGFEPWGQLGLGVG